MSNMAYCRFENTLADLRDCYENMAEPLHEDSYEYQRRKKLIDLCKLIAEEFGGEK